MRAGGGRERERETERRLRGRKKQKRSTVPKKNEPHTFSPPFLSSPSPFVFFRSVADPDSIRFLPLLQQPLTDGGAQKARMRGLLVERLGWRAIGCDTLDCFLE